MLELLSDPNAWVAFATLTALEIVLGIDNIVFIAILVARLPKEKQGQGRIIGLGLAMGARVVLLLSITWVMGLTETLFTVMAIEISGRDLILLIGGLFLVGKSTVEIHHSLEGVEGQGEANAASSFMSVLIQIIIIDVVFSLDSVITAVGLAEDVEIMIAAIVVAIIVMMLAAKSISDFVEEHPTVKMLALSFLILIGMTLVGEGLTLHIPKGYVYFAMAFSLGVEMLNMRLRKARAPMKLKKHLVEDQATA